MSALDVSGLAGFVVVLFWIARTIRQDARLTRRWQEIADDLRTANSDLEDRVHRLERSWRRERTRRVQLEGVLRDAGMPLPSRPADDEDPDPLDDPAEQPHRGHLIHLQRSRA